MNPKKEKLDEVKKLVTKATLKSGNCPPHFFVFGSKGNGILAIPEIPDTTEKKTKLFLLVGNKLAKEKKIGELKEFYFVSEGWLSVSKNKKFTCPPSKDPKRKEVIAIIGQTLGIKTKNKVVAFEMVRDKKDKLIMLKPYKELGKEKGKTESPLTEAFAFGFQMGRREIENQKERIVS